MRAVGVSQVLLWHYLVYRIPWEVSEMAPREIIPAFGVGEVCASGRGRGVPAAAVTVAD